MEVNQVPVQSNIAIKEGVGMVMPDLALFWSKNLEDAEMPPWTEVGSYGLLSGLLLN